MTDKKDKPIYIGDPKAKQSEIDWVCKKHVQPVSMK